MTAYDLAVLGGGPGGYATALRAAGHGLRVAIIEGDKVGGTCLHRGCVPSKALLHVAHLADSLPLLVDLGLARYGRGLDPAAAGGFRDGVVDQLHRGLEHLLGTKGIDTVRGWGTVVAPGEVAVDGTGPIRARHVVVATGSVAVDLPSSTHDGHVVMWSDDALRLERVPPSAVVVGGGAIGVELASLWRSLGSEVTILEASERLLPLEDPDSSRALTDGFARRGIDVRTSTGTAEVRRSEDGAVVETTEGDLLHAAVVLVAVGRRPATATTGLAELGVLDERGHVVTDLLGRTSIEGLWAVGDVRPTLALAHAAFAEGFVVADAIVGGDPEPVDYDLVPRVTYCDPEVASVGLTEPRAREVHGEGLTITSTTFAENARALIEGATGMVKLLTASDGTVVGAHVVGPSATELIGELGLATSWEALASEVGAVVHAHPSLAEAVRETAFAAAGTPFHSR